MFTIVKIVGKAFQLGPVSYYLLAHVFNVFISLFCYAMDVIQSNKGGFKLCVDGFMLHTKQPPRWPCG